AGRRASDRSHDSRWPLDQVPLFRRSMSPIITSQTMRVLKVTFFVLCAIVAAVWALGLLIGVWLPDVVFAPRSTIAYTKLPSGYTFRIVQYWNRVDFYSTELHIISPDGREQEHT